MELFKKIEEMRDFSQKFYFAQKKIGFVPTMGALHEGHVRLIKASQRENDCTILSLFLNPKQFDRKEDLLSYPCDEKKDCLLLKKLDVDGVFIPDRREIYSDDFSVFIDLPSLSYRHCGAMRKHHFSSVCTVISIFLNIIRPHFVYFGQKDYQQLIVIKKLLKDLKSEVKVISCPTVRESYGLAMSSRNRNLSEAQKQKASLLFNTLKEIKRMIQEGENSVEILEKWGKKTLNSFSCVHIEYLNIVDPETLNPLKTIKRSCVVLVAVFFEKVRLIDNILFEKVG